MCVHREVYLDHNKLSGPIPAKFGGLSALKYLFLNHNQLTGAVPAELFNMRNMCILRLDHNELTGALPDVPQRSGLTRNLMCA